MSYVTSNLYNTLFDIKTLMVGGSSFTQLIKEKRMFLFKTFLNLLVQLAITYFVMTKTHLPIQNWILFVCTIVIVLILSLVPMPPFIKFILFSAYSFFMGVLLSQGINGFDSSSIQYAILGAMGIFVAMIVAGIILLLIGIELGFYTFLFLFLSLLVVILLSIMQFYSSSINNVWLSNSIIGLFALFIVFDTQQILRRNYRGDFITASLDYYLDILNIFVRLLKSR
jgi:FtsH-binding integral membrane protein